MSETQESSLAAQAILEALPTLEESHALVLEIEAFIIKGTPISHKSAARLGIIVTGAAFVRRFGRAVVAPPPSQWVCCNKVHTVHVRDTHPELGSCVGWTEG